MKYLSIFLLLITYTTLVAGQNKEQEAFSKIVSGIPPDGAQKVSATNVHEEIRTGVVDVEGFAVDYIEVAKVTRCEAKWNQYCDAQYAHPAPKSGYKRCKFSWHVNSSNKDWGYSIRSISNEDFRMKVWVWGSNIPGDGRSWIDVNNHYFWVKSGTPPDVRRTWCQLPLDSKEYAYGCSSVFTPCGFNPGKPWPDPGRIVPSQPILKPAP